MNKLFNNRKLVRLADFLYLSVLWAVFSLPVITIGASTSALYYTIYYSVKIEEGYIFSEYWKAFKRTFKKATLNWILFLITASAFYLDSVIILQKTNGSLIGIVGQMFFLLLIPLECFLIIYIIPYISRFNSPLKLVWKNSAILAFANLFDTVTMFILLIISIMIIWLIPITVVILPAFVTYIISNKMEKIFAKYIREYEHENHLPM